MGDRCFAIKASDLVVIQESDELRRKFAQRLTAAQQNPNISHLFLVGGFFSVDSIRYLTTELIERRSAWETIMFRGFSFERTNSDAIDRFCKAILSRASELVFIKCDSLMSQFLVQSPSSSSSSSSSSSAAAAAAAAAAVQETRAGENCDIPVRIQRLYANFSKVGLNPEECHTLGFSIKQGLFSKVEELHLTGGLQAIDRFGVGLASAIALKALSLNGGGLADAKSPQCRQDLADLVVPRNSTNEFGFGAISRLLQQPQSCLRRLSLRNLKLEDEHAIRLAEILSGRTGADLEELNLTFNEIGNTGIIGFVHCLPRLSTLKKLSIGNNPWTGECCGTSWLDGMQLNYSIEDLGSSFLRKIPHRTACLLGYYTTLNRGGRRILSCDPSTVPISLWPLVLERAATISYTEGSESEEVQARLNVTFFFLQNMGR